MEGGGAHLGSSLPVSAFIRRWSFSCAGGRLRSRAPFSFACVIFVRWGSPWFVGLHLGSWAGIFGAVFVHVRRFHSRGVALVRGRSSSLVFVGLYLHSWAGISVRGRSPSFMGVRVRWWATAFVRGRSCHSCGVVGWGIGGVWWPAVGVVVVGPRGRSWWSSRVVASLLWLRRGSRWCA